MNKFLKDRYGFDELFRFNFYLCVLLLFIDIFINNIVLFYIQLILLFTLIFRFLSKNVNQRQKENIIFLDIRRKIRKKLNNNNIYRKCPKCKTKLRLPVKRGRHTVKCPECNYKFKVICLRKK